MAYITEKELYKLVVSEIDWDVDDKEDLETLPQRIEIDEIDDEDDEISDYISDMTGFCHNGFLTQEEKSIRKLAYQLYIIDWKHKHVTHEMEADAWKNYFMDTDADTMAVYPFDDFLWDAGYGSGTLYVCYQEFLGAEYRDEEYITALLDNEKLCEMYRIDLANLEE